MQLFSVVSLSGCKAIEKLCSIGRLEFCYGEDLPYKNLRTNVLETNWTMAKDGRCLLIMDPASTIISQLLQQLRKFNSFYNILVY